MVAAAALVAALVAACGGGGGGETKRLSAGAYREQATAHCATLERASDELRSAQAADATGETVTTFMHQAADRLRDLVASLDELAPPVALEEDADELVDGLDRYAAGLDDLAERVPADGTYEDTIEANPKTVARLNRIATQATRLVQRLELSGCLLSG